MATSEFVMLTSVSLAATHAIVIVRKSLLPLISQIETKELAMGFGNRLPNKGAVSISFTLDGKRLLFINCHLAAHIYRRTQRN